MINFLFKEKKDNDSAGNTASKMDLHPAINPLAEPPPVWYEFYKRVKLFPWWLKYNLGLGQEAVLKDKIIQLGTKDGITR